MKNLLEIDDLSSTKIEEIFTLARELTRGPDSLILKNHLVANIFFEPSTRTSVSFNIAAQALGARTINLAPISSSMQKGETFLDTITVISSYHPSFLVVRHPESGILHNYKDKFSFSIINAGDGTNEHPTQALIDAFTLQNYFPLEGLNIGICGDILHSRVAHSSSKIFKHLGALVTLIAPTTLLPRTTEFATTSNLMEEIKKLDVLMLLRIQSERMQKSYIPSLNEYYNFFGLTLEVLENANPELKIMHPGPFNRNVEIETRILDRNKNILINKQVQNSIAIRKAVFAFLLNKL